MRYVPMLCSVLALSCGQPNTNPNLPTDPNMPVDPAAKLSEGLVNGSRLRHRYFVAEDGTVAGPSFSIQYAPLFDTQLGIPCGFQRAVDGKYLCQPLAATGSTYYLDSNCTQPIRLYFQRDVDQDVAFALDTTKYISDTAGNYFHSVEMRPLPSNVYNLNGSSGTGTCTSIALPAGALHGYTRGAPAPTTDFVAATLMY